MSKQRLKNILLILAAVLYLLFAVVMSTACTGAGAAGSNNQVQITFGDNEQVNFATLYDALAWLNSCESNGTQEAGATARGYNGYLSAWQDATGKSGYTAGSKQPNGQFQITILLQAGVESKPAYGLGGSGDAGVIGGGIKTLLAMDNPYADVTLATRNNFNVNLNPTGNAGTANLNIGYAKFTVDAMKLSSAHTLYMMGNDFTAGSNFTNYSGFNVYAGNNNEDCIVRNGIGLHDGISTLVIKAAGANIGTLSGGNAAGGTFTGDSVVRVNAATRIAFVYGAGGIGNATNGTSIHNGNVTVDMNGGNVVNLCGAGSLSSVTSGNITVNMNGGTVTNLSGGAYWTQALYAGDIDVNINAGTIQSNLYGTQWGAADSYYNNVTMDIKPITAKGALTLKGTVAGNRNAAMNSVMLNVDSTAATSTDFSQVANWYLVNVEASTIPTGDNTMILNINAPGGNFKNITGVNAGTMSEGQVAKINIETADTIADLYGFGASVANTGSLLSREADITIGTTGAATEANRVRLNISGSLKGFRNLTINNTELTVANQLYAEATQTAAIDAWTYLPQWYVSAKGDIIMNGDSVLNTPTGGPGMTLVRNIDIGDGSTNNIVYGRGGNVQGNASTVTSPERCGIDIAGAFNKAIKVGANANGPTASYINPALNYANTKTILNFPTKDARIASTKPEPVKDLYDTFVIDADNYVTQYIYLGLTDDAIIKVTNDDHPADFLKYSNLQAAYDGINDNYRGSPNILGTSTTGYTITFLADFDIGAAWTTYENFLYVNGNDYVGGVDKDRHDDLSLTYTGYDGEFASDQYAPAGTSTITMPENPVWIRSKTIFKNIRIANVGNIYANGYPLTVAGGVQYLNADKATKAYIGLYGAHANGDPHTYDNIEKTSLTIYSGTYIRVAGGYYTAPTGATGSANTPAQRFDDHKRYSTVIHGGDFTGGIAMTTKSITTQDGESRSISYVPYGAQNINSVISGAYMEGMAGGYNGSSEVHVDSAADAIDLTIQDATIEGTDKVYTIKAPGAVVFLVNRATYEWGKKIRDPLSINQFFACTPTITIDTQQALNFGGLSRTFLNFAGSFTYVYNKTSVNFITNINAPNSTFDIIMGVGNNVNQPYRSVLNIENLEYANTIAQGAFSWWGNDGYSFMEGEDYAQVNITGKVNVGGIQRFSQLNLTGEDAELNVLSSSVDSSYALGLHTMLSAGQGDWSPANIMTFGDLNLRDGAVLNLYGNHANIVNHMNVYGFGNKLNVTGNVNAHNTANPLNGWATTYGTLGLPNGNNLLSGDGNELILGMVPNSPYLTATADETNGFRKVNIISVTDLGNIRMASGGTGGYYDFVEVVTGENMHFTSADSAFAVRTDAYKNYIGSAGSGLYFDKTPVAMDGTLNKNRGYIYLGAKAVDTDINVIDVRPDPDKVDNHHLYFSLEDAAIAIQGSEYQTRDYTITFLSTYKVTSADVDAVKGITTEKTNNLTFNGKFDPSIINNELFPVPAQERSALDMDNKDFTLGVPATFTDMYLINSPLSFAGGTDVTINDSVKMAVADKTVGGTITSATTGSSADSLTTTNTYRKVEGKVEDFNGEFPTYLVDENGYVWKESLDMETSLNIAVQGQGGLPLYTIDTVDVDGSSKDYTKTTEIYSMELENTDLPIHNADNINNKLTVNGDRFVVITGSMNNTNVVEVANTLLLKPEDNEGTFERYTYSVGSLTAQEDTLALMIPKDANGTNPINVSTVLPNNYQLGIINYGTVTPASGDDLITGTAVWAAESAKYTELSGTLSGIPIKVTDGLVELDPDFEGVSAKDFWIKAEDVYTDPDTKTYNETVILDADHANPKYIDENGTTTEGAMIVSDGTTLDNDSSSEKQPYDVEIGFTGKPLTKIVKATVFDNIVDDRCHILGANNFDIAISELLSANNADKNDGVDKKVALIAKIIAGSNATVRDKATSIETIMQLENTDIVCNVQTEVGASLNDISAANSAEAIGKAFDVTIHYTCGNGETHLIDIKVTPFSQEDPGIYANDFSISYDEVYKDSDKNYNLERFIELANAYGVTEERVRTKEGLGLLDFGSNYDDGSNVYTVDLIDVQKAGYTVVFTFGDYMKAVKVQVVGNQTIDPDPHQLEVVGPETLTEGPNQFKAVDPITGEEITDVTWSIEAVDKDGEPVTIPGASIDPTTGELTMPDPAGIPDGTKLTVTATPKDNISDKYGPGSITYPFTGDGNEPPLTPNVGINSSNFPIGVDEIANAADLATTVKDYSGVKAWKADTKEAISKDNINVEEASLDALSAAKQGDIVDVIFYVIGDDGTKVATTAKATITDHSTIKDGIVMSANDFEYGDSLFDVDGNVLKTETAKKMVIMLSQAKAMKAEDGSVLAVSLADTEMDKLDNTDGFISDPLTFTAELDGGSNSVTAIGKYRSENVVDPTDPVVPTPDDPDPDYGKDIQISANDFVFGDELFEDGADKDAWSIMLAQASAKKVSDGTPLEITGVTYVPALEQDDTIAFRVTFTATNGENTLSNTVTARYSANAIVSPDVPVDPYDPTVDPQPDPDYKDDIQINGFDFTTTQEALAALTSEDDFKAFLLRESNSFAKVVSTGEKLDVEIKDSALVYNAAGEYESGEKVVTIQATNPDTEATKKTTFTVTVTSQKLTVNGPDKVEPGNEYEYTATDENGDPVTDATWSVVDENGEPIPGMTIDENGKLTVGSDVPGGQKFAVKVETPDGKYGQRDGTVQDPESEPKAAQVSGGKLQPGQTTEFTATDPTTGDPLTGGEWSLENPLDPAGNPVNDLISTSGPADDKIYIDPDGKVTVGKDVPVGSSVEVTYTPAETSGLEPGSQWANVQPGADVSLTYDYRPGETEQATTETHTAYSEVTTRAFDAAKDTAPYKTGSTEDRKTLFAWNSKPAIDSKSSFLPGATFQMPNEAVTLTAVWKDNVDGSIAANDFSYAVEGGVISENGAKNLAGVEAFNTDGSPRDLSEVKVNADQLKAINDAIKAGNTEEPFDLTFTNPGVDMNNDSQPDTVTVKVTLTSKKLIIKGADDVEVPEGTDPNKYPLTVTDDTGADRSEDADWSVTDPNGDPIPGVRVEKDEDGKPVLVVDPGVDPGTDFVIKAEIPEEGKSGEKTGTVQGDEDPGDDKQQVKVNGDNLQPGKTTEFTAKDPETGTPMTKDDGEWSLEEPKNPDGTTNDDLIATDPDDPEIDKKIYIDPDGNVTVGKDVPLGSTVKVTYTPNDDEKFAPGDQFAEVQPGDATVVTYDYRPGETTQEVTEQHPAYSEVTTRAFDAAKDTAPYKTGSTTDRKTLFAWNSKPSIDGKSSFLPGATFQMPNEAVTLTAVWKDYVNGSIAANDFSYAIEGGVISAKGAKILAGVEAFDSDGNVRDVSDDTLVLVGVDQLSAINAKIIAGKAGDTLELTFTNSGVDIAEPTGNDTVTIKVTLTSQKLTIGGADDVTVPAEGDPANEYPLTVTDDKGDDRSDEAEWSVTDPNGDPIPGVTIGEDEDGNPVLKVEPGVDPGTDFVIKATTPDGKSGEKAGTVQGDEPPVDPETPDNPNAEIEGGNLAPGQTTDFNAKDPTTGDALEDGEWSLENAKNPDGTLNPDLISTTPADDKISIDPTTGEVTVGKDVPLGSSVDVKYTPDPDTEPGLDPGSVSASVQPVEVTNGVTVVKPTDPIYPGMTSDPFQAIDNKTGEPLTDAEWSVVDPDTGDPIPGISIGTDGRMTVDDTVEPGTPYKVVATLPDGRTGEETGEIQNEPGTTPTTDPTLNITGPQPPLVPGGTSEFKAVDPETGEDLTDDPDTEWEVKVKDENGNWVDPEPGTVTIDGGKVTVDPSVDPGTEIKVTATNGDKTGSEEANVQEAPKYEYEFEIIKVTHKGETTDLTKTDGEQVDILTGAWNEDDEVTYTFRLKIKPFGEAWRPATDDEIKSVTLTQSLIGGFEMIKGSDGKLLTADKFAKLSDAITVTTGDDNSYGYGQFTLTAIKSGIMEVTARYGSSDATTGDNKLIAVVPGDVDRDGIINAYDTSLIRQTILKGKENVPEANKIYAEKLMDVDGDEINNAYDASLIRQMITEKITTN